jgi:hypothetical protein
MYYGQRETFFWLKEATLLSRTSVVLSALEKIEEAQQQRFWAGDIPEELHFKLREIAETNFANEIISAVQANPGQIREYCKIRRSHDMGESRLIHLLRKELSLAELDSKANEQGQLSSGGVKMNEKRFALRIAKVTGTIWDPIVRFGIEQANKESDNHFFKELGRALELKKRPAEIDYQCISIVARFLIDLWCGEKGIYGMWMKMFETRDTGVVASGEDCYRCSRPPAFYFHPPLCFFSSGALATYCAMALGKEQSDRDTSVTATKKWVSRLGLQRASAPRIRDVKVESGGVWFRA